MSIRSKQAFLDDPQWAASEYGAAFRGDLEAFVSLETLNRCTDGVGERLPERMQSYVAFVDPSGGSNDSMTLAISHVEGKLVVLDKIVEVIPPFVPSAAVEQFADVLRHYQVFTVHGDRYAGEWPRDQFLKRDISYEISERNKSDIYRDFLPLLNSRAVALIDHRRMRQQFVALERRITRGGRDSIDHPPGPNHHDDIANCVAGSCLAALEQGALMPAYRLPAHASDGGYDALDAFDRHMRGLPDVPQQRGYFSGPGWAPTWHSSGGDDEQQIGYGIDEIRRNDARFGVCRNRDQLGIIRVGDVNAAGRPYAAPEYPHCGNSFNAVSAPSKVLVWTAKMLSLDLGIGHEAARLHHASRRSASGQRNVCGVTKHIGSCRSYWRGFKRDKTYSKVPRRHRRPGTRSGLLASRAGPTSGSY
jgi:hypothetical protein